jgi:asparagine synthetase B (glutamine-hydrolysing)
MAVALEVRPVFLHRDMLQLAAAIPGARLAGPEQAKEVLKVAVESWLPAGNIRRPKQGFLAPVSRWLRESNEAEWSKSAGSVLPELLDLPPVPGIGQAEVEGRHSGVPDFQVLLLDRWLAEWQPQS